jgi:tetratricopeptide (TPR) repeat protein
VALPLAPADPEFYFTYADWLGAMGRTDEALQAAQRAVTLDPMAPAYRNLYGYLLYYSGRIDESIAQLEAGHALNPGMGYIEKNLFESYVRAGRLADAEKLRNSLRDAIVARGESPAQVASLMAVMNAIVAIARQPNDYATIVLPLEGNAFASEIPLAFPSHLGDLFETAAYMIDHHEGASDGVVLLRSSLFADHHHDPRYLHLLEKAGFDENGVPR